MRKRAKTAAEADYTYDAEQIDFLDKHKVYRGSVVTNGEAIMQVKCVGDKSQFGRLAQELKEDEERESPLKVKLGKVADTISKFGYIGGTLIANRLYDSTVSSLIRRCCRARRRIFPPPM